MELSPRGAHTLPAQEWGWALPPHTPPHALLLTQPSKGTGSPVPSSLCIPQLTQDLGRTRRSRGEGDQQGEEGNPKGRAPRRPRRLKTVPWVSTLTPNIFHAFFHVWGPSGNL